ncbi:hypothetical protein TWF281_003723 [Arthrobotrys megalospora]
MASLKTNLNNATYNTDPRSGNCTSKQDRQRGESVTEQPNTEILDGGKPNEPRFPRISLPVELMRDSYDVVVIGTGYGGGVAANRMARGRQQVCVLERGKERYLASSQRHSRTRQRRFILPENLRQEIEEAFLGSL